MQVFGTDRKALAPHVVVGDRENRSIIGDELRTAPALPQLAGEPDRPTDEIGRKAGRGLLIERARVADLDQPALVHQRDAVGKPHRLGLVVRDDECRGAGLTQNLAQLDPQRLAQLGVEIGERLIEQKKLGRDRERAGERDALLLAAAELAGPAFIEPFETA